MTKTIGIVGLGLIGGSFAKAIKKYTEDRVFGFDLKEETIQAALDDGVIDDKITTKNLSCCNILILALYPNDSIDYFVKNCDYIKKATVVFDTCGVKQKICDRLTTLAGEKNIYFVGGHPMAGTTKSGYENSFAELFLNASMVLCKEDSTNIVALKTCELLCEKIGFGKIKICSAKMHDEMIAYTSQLAHIVSSAYIQSEKATNHNGFNGGSFADMTRVANLSENMWTELFFENRENLSKEINALISRLTAFDDCLNSGDREKMNSLLIQGKLAKIISEKK